MALNTHIWLCNEVTSKSSPSSPISHQPTCSGPARFSLHNSSAAYGHIVDLCFILQAVYEHTVYLKYSGDIKIMLLKFHVHNLKRPCLSYYNNRSEWRRDHQMCYALFRGGTGGSSRFPFFGRERATMAPLPSFIVTKTVKTTIASMKCVSVQPLLGHVVYCPWNSFIVISTDTER